MPPIDAAPEDAPDDAASRFRYLLDKNYARWTGIARAYAPPSDRDDLVQEIALQVWKSLPGFTGAASVDTWAYRVALNTALAWRRKLASRSARLRQVSHDVAAIAGDSTDEESVVAVLDRFVASIHDAERAVLLLHLDGIDQADAADVLGISPGAYRTRLHRVRRRFEAMFGKTEGER
jgi:RNA polymerase sigma-70 factor (ECF subfamily)